MIHNDLIIFGLWIYISKLTKDIDEIIKKRSGQRYKILSIQQLKCR